MADPKLYPVQPPEWSARDEFAAVALQGMLASAPMCDRTKIDKLRWAEVSYDWADAMLVMRRGKRRAK